MGLDVVILPDFPPAQWSHFRSKAIHPPLACLPIIDIWCNHFKISFFCGHYVWFWNKSSFSVLHTHCHTRPTGRPFKNLRRPSHCLWHGSGRVFSVTGTPRPPKRWMCGKSNWVFFDVDHPRCTPYLAYLIFPCIWYSLVTILVVQLKERMRKDLAKVTTILLSSSSSPSSSSSNWLSMLIPINISSRWQPSRIIGFKLV